MFPRCPACNVEVNVLLRSAYIAAEGYAWHPVCYRWHTRPVDAPRESQPPAI